MAKKIDLDGLDHFKSKENASIAGTESTSTASKAYAVGDYFYFKGELVICTSPIAASGTITLNTNCAKQPLADSVTTLKNALSGDESILALDDAVSVGFDASTSGYIKYNTGVLTDSSTYNATDYIDITLFSSISYKRVGTTASNVTSGMAFYDSSKTYISGARTALSQDSLGYLSDLYTITVPTNAVYARFTTFADTTTYGDFALYGNSVLNTEIEAIQDSIEDGVGVLRLLQLLETSGTTVSNIINSSGNITTGNSRSSWELSNSSYKTMMVTAGGNSVYVSFLSASTSSLSSGDAVTFATDETGRHEISASTTELLVIPTDCTYIHISKYGTGDLSPTDGYIFGSNNVIATIIANGEAEINADIEDVEEEINAIRSYDAFEDIPWKIGKQISSSGSTSDDSGWAITDLLPVNVGNKVKYTGSLTDSDGYALICWLHEYNENGEWIKRTQMTFTDGTTEAEDVVLGDSTVLIRFCYGYTDSITITEETCSTYFAAKISNVRGDYKPSLSILFVGNSLAYDSVSYVPSVLKSLDVDANITIGILYLGGQSLDLHYGHFTSDDTVYTLTESVNMTPWRNVLTEATGLDIITYRKWDMISFQQASTKAGDYSTYQPYLTDLIEYICNNVSYKWKMAWNNVHSTSVYNETDTVVSPADHALTLSNYQLVITALESLLAENPIEIVFPVATATQNARGTDLASYGVDGELLYDGKHAQEGIACQVEGYTIAIKIMELLGINNKSVINDNTVIDSDFEDFWNIQGQHGSPVGSTDDDTGKANRRIAQKCAILACQRPLEVSTILTPST